TLPVNLYSLSFPTRRSSDLKIRELHDFLFDIFEQVEVAENQVSGRQEISAVKIDTEIWKLKESLKLTFFEEDSQWQALNRTTIRSEEHTSELQSRFDLVCRL